MPAIRYIGLVRSACGLAVALAPVPARADGTTWMPGNSREIPRTVSASRDAAVSELVFAERVSAKGAADFAFAKFDAGGVALRPGFFGIFELQHADTGVKGPLPLPGEGNGPMLWRGLFGVTLSLSAEELAHRWLGPRGAIEVVATVGHESDHVTVGRAFDPSVAPGGIVSGGGGNFAIYELSSRVPVADRVEAWARIQDRVYWAGPILHAPGAEAGLRWRARPHFQPLLSAFTEALLVDPNVNKAKNGGFVGVLLGAGLPGAMGELIPYFAIDAGNGKGLIINEREVTYAIGFRYAPF